MDIPPPMPNDRAGFQPSSGKALACLIAGIIALGLSFMVVGVIFGLAGIGIGITSLNRHEGGRKMVRWGIALCSLGTVASIAFAFLFFHLIKSAATLSKAGVGAPAMAPSAALTGAAPLPAAKSPFKSTLLWSNAIPGAVAMCVGDWDGAGTAEILVVSGPTLHVLDLAGTEKSKLNLPGLFTVIECGHTKSKGQCLLGYTVPFAREVSLIDHSGKVMWKESAIFGVNGTHWADFAGDGDENVVVGYNGTGGVTAFSGEKKELWNVRLGNAWSHAFIPATLLRPAAVAACEASGSIILIDGAGKTSPPMRPEGGYYTRVCAGLTETNAAQLLGFANGAVVAFDESGTTSWIAAAAPASPGVSAFAVLGDLLGDGTSEWIFSDPRSDLNIATSTGTLAGTIARKTSVQAVAVAPRKSEGALLLVLDGGIIWAYSFTP